MPPTDRNLFFGPLVPSDRFVEFDDTFNWLDVLVTIGMFKSKSEARKNASNVIGVNWAIPQGFTRKIFGKKRIAVFILNRIPEPKQLVFT